MTGSPNWFSLKRAKNNINAGCSFTFVKPRQAVETWDRERQSTTNQDLVTWVVLGFLGILFWFFFFLSFARKQLHTDCPGLTYHHVKPSKDALQWQRSLVWERYLLLSVPQQLTQPADRQGHDTCDHYNPVIFFPEKTLLPWSWWHGKPLLPLCPEEAAGWKLICRLETKQHLLQKGLASLEPGWRSMIDL